jgi:hypothetical protein
MRASGVARHKTIRFTQSHAIIGDLEGTGTGLLTAADPMQIEGATHWRYTPRNQPPWVATADLRGDLNKLPFTVRITEPMTASIGGELLTLTKQWRWIGKARISDFDLRAWGAGGALGRITGDLALSGNRDGFRAQGPLDSAGLAAGPFDALFEGNWVRGALRADRIQLVHQQSRSTVEAKGEIRVVENGPQLELAGDWSQLRWPLVGAAPAIVKSGGNFTFSGIWPYSIVASGQFDSPDLGETIPFSMSGQLAKAGLTISRGDAKLYDGTAQLRGQVGLRARCADSIQGVFAPRCPAASASTSICAATRSDQKRISMRSSAICRAACAARLRAAEAVSSARARAKNCAGCSRASTSRRAGCVWRPMVS